VLHKHRVRHEELKRISMEKNVVFASVHFPTPNSDVRFPLESERMERQKTPFGAFKYHCSPHCEYHVERPAPFQDFQPGSAPSVEKSPRAAASLVLPWFFLHPYELVITLAFAMSY
jgi:hypothetical protein